MQLKRFLGKIASTLAIGALSATAYAGADEYPGHGQFVGNWGHGGEPAWGCAPQPCCPPPQCCNAQPCEPPACGVAYNPPAYFWCNDCNPSCCTSFWDSLRVRADFLWWRACEDGLALGTEEYVAVFPDKLNTFQKARLKKPDFKYDPGFRIGINSICPCDCYDVALNWTHYHTKASVEGASVFNFRETGNFAETIFIPLWQRVRNAIPDVSKGKWTLTMDLLDLEFGRKYYVSNCFILRPFLGLRGARLDQTYRVFATANRFDPYDVDQSAFFTSETKARNNFLGVGPRVGFDIEVKLPCCLTIYGQGAGSLVFGRFDRHSHEDYENFSSTGELYDDTPGNVEFKTKSTQDRCSRAITDLSIGIKWDHCCTWCNRSHPVTIAFAWEHHAFFNFNNFLFEQGLQSRGDDAFTLASTNGLGDVERHGDLTTQGLTVKFEVGF